MSNICIECGIREVYCKELCHKCYMQQYRHNNKERLIISAKQWRKNNPDVCKANWRRCSRRNGQKSMSKNRSCSMFLGVHIAERVLSMVFDNVKQMQNCNPGYDFICDKGKKIDVKSSCLRYSGKTPFWSFHTEYNKIPDYFLCLAFDNRKNLTPLHMWLLPTDKFNHLSAAVISTSTIDKWNRYNISVDKVTGCCDILR